MKHKRARVPFDTTFFKKEIAQGIRRTITDKFTFIYNSNHWSGKKSLSGNGSSFSQTREIRQRLPELIEDYKIKVMLDSSEPLFFCGSDELAVFDESGRCIMIKTGYAQNIHQNCFLKSSFVGWNAFRFIQWDGVFLGLSRRGSEKILTARAKGRVMIK